jgi:hypothetical protein
MDVFLTPLSPLPSLPSKENVGSFAGSFDCPPLSLWPGIGIGRASLNSCSWKLENVHAWGTFKIEKYSPKDSEHKIMLQTASPSTTWSTRDLFSFILQFVRVSFSLERLSPIACTGMAEKRGTICLVLIKPFVG